MTFDLADYHYDLPRALIAQHPVRNREASRLLYLNRKTGARSHHLFRDILQLLDPTDVMVVNNTEVVPARLTGTKETGGRVEVLLLNYGDPGIGEDTQCPVYACLVKSAKRLRPGTAIRFGKGLAAEVIAFSNGIYRLAFTCSGSFEERMYEIGATPLPPYIHRSGNEPPPCNDRIAYQTVYASQRGAVAAPTAGLHFSRKLLDQIRRLGIQIVEVTLHVSYDTFLPVRTDDIRNHRLHGEKFFIGSDTAEALNRAKAEGRRIVAVGTTSVRTLETAADGGGAVAAGTGVSELFICPGYRFRAVDAMITNFHLPGSTLLMLVSAFAGRENILAAYAEAVRENYRFFSYGDAMLLA